MADTDPLHVLALSGSLRKASFNSLLLRAAASCAPASLRVSLYEPGPRVPLFDEDLEAVGTPQEATLLSSALAQADAVLIATPEYNQSIPGVLKNALDWVSRQKPHPLAAKPLAILGATTGPWGTRYAQATLRHTLTGSGALVMPTPQMYVRGAQGALGDAQPDAATVESLTRFMAAFADWIAFARKR
jgi:chromate reductase, NAD(P)H dehydrogenase (quinone)